MLKLSKNALKNIVERMLLEGRSVYAPKHLEKGDYAFDLIYTPDEFQIDGFVNTLLPPKEIFFREIERIGRYVPDEPGTCEYEEIKPEDKVILGIRPCDLEGLLLIDSFYNRVETDMPYKRRREKTFIVVYACPEPAETCFCNETDSGPQAKRGFDWQLHQLDSENYLLELGSQKGEEYARNFGEIVPASLGDLELFERKKKATLKKFRERPHIKGGIENFKKVGEEIYRYLGERCFRCGGCNYLCPTCTCYNVADIKNGEGERVIFWDSCQYEGFSRLAGNLNPRPEQWNRLKFRFECKLADWNIAAYGRIRCTGCGRCILSCIGDADIEVFWEKASEI